MKLPDVYAAITYDLRHRRQLEACLEQQRQGPKGRRFRQGYRTRSVAQVPNPRMVRVQAIRIEDRGLLAGVRGIEERW